LLGKQLDIAKMSENTKILMDNMSEVTATTQIRVGFDEAFTLHHRTVFRTARAVVQDAGLAEDVTQEVFIRLYKNMDAIKNEEMLRPWLIRVALNLAKNAIRGNSRATVREDNYVKEVDESFGSIDPEMEYERAQQVKEVRTALDQIREPLRSCLILKQQGLSYKEIADSLTINETSVGTFVARARKEFVRFYGETRGDA
jgi:RNA polymerase sigma factor (sigma-70 family)